MGRNIYGVYELPAAYLAETGNTIQPTQHNTPLEDLETDANTVRPVVAGGTGGNSASTARTALGVDAKASYSSKSANYTAVAADNNSTIKFTAAATLSLTAAATLTSGWGCFVIADGGALVVDPAGAELINGAATLSLADGESVIITCSGTDFAAAIITPSTYDWAAAVVAASAKATPIDADSIGLVDSAAANVLKEVTIAQLKAVILASPTLTGTPVAPTQSIGDNSTKIATTAYADRIGGLASRRIYTSGATWTKPTGLVKVIVTVIGGGGGSGGKNNNTGSYSGGGGGSGGASIKEILAASLGATEAVTVGAAGTAGTNAANGGNGGTSSFGVHCSATGGNGGTFANGANGTGGAAGAGSGGLTDITGEIGETGTVGTSTGRGSQGPLGTLGAVARTSTGNGNAPPQYSGCGAVAGGHTGTTTAQGAAGSIGLVIVEEYFA